MYKKEKIIFGFRITMVFFIALLLTAILEVDNVTIATEQITPAYSNPEEELIWEKNLIVPAENLNALTYNGTVYVVVGNTGTIKISEDGTTWETIDSQTIKNLYGVAWNGNIFVAVGEDGIILTSEDSVVWQEHKYEEYPIEVIIDGETRQVSLLNRFTLNDIVWGNGRFIAVGDRGRMWKSYDGIEWKAVYNQSTHDLNLGSYEDKLNSIIWTEEEFIAVGNGLIISSPNGENWTKNKNEKKYSFEDIIWDGTCYVVVGETTSRKGVILTSTDKVSWNKAFESDTPQNSIVLNNGIYYSVGGHHLGTIYKSKDLNSWSNITPETEVNIYKINNIYNISKKLITIGQYGNFLTSEDGSSWEHETLGITYSDLSGIAFNGDVYVVTGTNGTILFSYDGDSWLKVDEEIETTVNITDVIWNGEKFIAVGNNIVLTSDDGYIWKQEDLFRTTAFLNSITWNGEKLIAVGRDGVIVTSGDGEIWEEVDSVTNNNLNNITWDGSNFFAVGTEGTIINSGDGINWSVIQEGQDYELLDITWNGKQFVAVGDCILSSDDGISWTRRSLEKRIGTREVVYGDHMYLALISNDDIFMSDNGVSWTSYNVGSGNRLEGVFYDGSSFFAVGRNGTIFRSSKKKAKPDYGEEILKWKKNISICKEALLDGTYNEFLDLYIAVGNNGKIKSSQNGEIWSNVPSPTISSLQSVSYNDNLFVAVGQEGAIITSTDGLIWTERESGVLSDLNSVTFGGNKFIAVGSPGTILISYDGIEWDVVVSGYYLDLKSVTYENNKFVVVGGSHIFTSVDGVNWINRTPKDSRLRKMTDITWADNKYVAVGYRTIIYSQDGIVWHGMENMYEDSFSSIMWTGEKYIAFSVPRTIYISDNGINWNEREIENLNWGLSIFKGNNEAVVLSEEGVIMNSPDGEKWSLRSNERHFNGITWGKNNNKKLYVAVGCERLGYQGGWSNDIGVIYTSNNGEDWEMTNKSSGSARYMDVLYKNGVFVAVGGNGEIVTSNNGFDWIKRESNTSNLIRKIIWNGKEFLAFGNHGTVLKSKNGTNWNNLDTDTGEIFTSVAWSGEKYVATTLSGKVIKSSNAIHWTEISESLNRPRSIAWGNGKFVAAGSNLIHTSSDGVKWVTKTRSNLFYAPVVWANNKFIMVGSRSNNKVIFSEDGIEWSENNVVDKSIAELNDIIWDGSQYIIVGENSTVIHGVKTIKMLKETKKLISDEGKATAWFPNSEILVEIKSNQNGKITVGRYSKDFKGIPTNMRNAEIFLDIQRSDEFAGANLKIEVQYDAELLHPNIKESSLALWRYNDDMQEWEQMSGGVDTEKKVVWGETNDSSVFGVFGKPAVLYGDVNGDGAINVSDAILVLRHIVGLVKIDDFDSYDEDAYLRAKVGGEEKLTVSDAILILRYIVGLTELFPVEK